MFCRKKETLAFENSNFQAMWQLVKQLSVQSLPCWDSILAPRGQPVKRHLKNILTGLIYQRIENTTGFSCQGDVNFELLYLTVASTGLCLAVSCGKSLNNNVEPRKSVPEKV